MWPRPTKPISPPTEWRVEGSAADPSRPARAVIDWSLNICRPLNGRSRDRLPRLLLFFRHLAGDRVNIDTVDADVAQFVIGQTGKLLKRGPVSPASAQEARERGHFHIRLHVWLRWRMTASEFVALSPAPMYFRRPSFPSYLGNRARPFRFPKQTFV